MTQKYLGRRWCGLPWSRWVPFSESDFRDIPPSAGVYRVKPVNKDILVYIGETGRSLRERLRTLCGEVAKKSMPFNDPHTAAPCLWALKEAGGMEFECSAAPRNLGTRQRKGLECYLLWKYRLERGESPLCGLGRFHRSYTKSKSGSTGKRGRRLPKGKLNPAGKASARPLAHMGKPSGQNWMGLHWTEAKPLIRGSSQELRGAGLYKILRADTKKLLYIGQSRNLHSRFQSHDWGRKGRSIWFSKVRQSTLNHQLRELENDLIGAFYHSERDVPPRQFRGR